MTEQRHDLCCVYGQGCDVTKSSALEVGLMDARIQELVSFARDRDGEDRTILFRNLVDLFLTGKAPRKEPTRSQILDVVEAMIPHVEPESRRTVAELVSQLSDPPIDLIRRLVKDLPHLVGDLLLSPALTEEDIVDLIATTGREHHHIIASRTDLSANIWIALARAAPSARKAQAPSSLALWSDALGYSANSDRESNLVPMHTPSKDVTLAPTQSSQANAITEVFRENEETPGTDMKSGEVDHGARQAASLRILRTDKDLISDRLADNTQKNAFKYPHGHANPAPTSTTHPSVPEQREMTQQQSVSLPAEPEDGGWCWRSDRDGLIIAVSNMGQNLFARASWQSQAPSSLQGVSIVGIGMLDLLNLNEKTGHPLARAFQRRSTVHDAPLTIETLEDGHKNWSLEAIPLFNSTSGAFEGYEGLMKPLSHEADDPVFTKEHTTRTNTVLHDDVRKSSDTLVDESIDRTVTPPPATRAVTEPKPNPTQVNNSIHEMTTNAVMQAIADALGTAANPVSSDAPQLPSDSSATAAGGEDDLDATLNLLEQSLSQILETSKNAGGARLQAEIAAACLRTLRDQLKNK